MNGKDGWWWKAIFLLLFVGDVVFSKFLQQYPGLAIINVLPYLLIVLLANLVLISTYIFNNRQKLRKNHSAAILLYSLLFFINLLIIGFFVPIVDYLPEPRSTTFAEAVTFGFAGFVTLLETAVFRLATKAQA